MVLFQVAGGTQTWILQEMPSVRWGVEECQGGGKGDKAGGRKEKCIYPGLIAIILTTDPMLHMIALAQDY